MDTNTPQPNGWQEWSRHVLAELVRLNNCLESIEKDMTDLKVNVGMLKVQSGLVGLIGGLIPSAIVLVWWIIENKH